MLQLFPSPDATEAISLDLVTTLDRKSPANRSRTRDGLLRNSYWLPPSFSSNSSECRQEVIQFFAKPCSLTGFSLISGKMTQRPQKSGLVPLRLVCSRSRLHEKNKKSKHKYSTKTSRPKCPSERCPFGFYVYFDPQLTRWILPKSQSGCSSHCSHPQLDPSFLTVRKSTIDLEELELVFQQLKLNINPSLVSKLFAERTGTTLSASQIRKFRQLGQDLVVGGNVASPADRLMHHLNSDSSIHYIALTASRSMENLVTIRQSRRDKTGMTHTQVNLQHDHSNESASTFAETILQSLTLSSTQKLLLCVSWTTEDAKLLFDRFPYCFGTDITNGTNQEKRPLARATAMTTNRKNVPFWNALLPSGGRWVHRWIFQEAFPALFSTATLMKCQLVISDEDVLCYEEFEAAIRAGVFPNGKHRLCKWHKINRNYAVPARKFVERDSAADMGFISLVSDWLYSFCDSIETEEEETFHLSELERRVQASTDVSPRLRSFTLEYLCKSFRPVLHRLCYRHFMFTPEGDVGSNSFSESENSALKRDHSGPRPQQSVATAQFAIQSHERVRHRSTVREAVLSLSQSMSQSPTKTPTDGESPSSFDNQLKEVENQLSNILVKEALQDIIAQERLSRQFRYRRVSPTKFWVRMDQRNNVIKHPEIPHYDRTRVVEIVDINGAMRAKCSCGHYQRHHRTCRHIRCIFSNPLSCRDFGLRNTKMYSAHYGQIPQFTQAANTLCVSDKFGPVLPARLQFNEDLSSHDSEWQSQALPGCLQVYPQCSLLVYPGMATGYATFETLVGDPEEDDINNYFPDDDGFPCADLFGATEAHDWKSSYREVHPTFARCSDLVVDRASYETFRRGMEGVLQQMTALHSGGTRDEWDHIPFPAVDRRTVDKRKAPLMSPSRKRRHTKIT